MTGHTSMLSLHGERVMVQGTGTRKQVEIPSRLWLLMESFIVAQMTTTCTR